jgi:putative membrane protein
MGVNVRLPLDYPTAIPNPTDEGAMLNLVIRLLVNAVALWVAAQLVSGIELSGDFWPVILVAAVFGLVNALIKPVAMILSLPLLVITLGLFTIVVNALMLMLTGAIVSALEVTGFGPAILGALIVSVVSILYSIILPEKKIG